MTEIQPLPHYGLAFLELMKKDGLYGEFFSCEEYQILKKAATKAEFEQFIRSTVFTETHVFDQTRNDLCRLPHPHGNPAG